MPWLDFPMLRADVKLKDGLEWGVLRDISSKGPPEDWLFGMQEGLATALEWRTLEWRLLWSVRCFLAARGAFKGFKSSKIMFIKIYMLRLTKKADYGLMALKYLAEHEASTAGTAAPAMRRAPRTLRTRITFRINYLRRYCRRWRRPDCWSRTRARTAAMRCPGRRRRSQRLRSFGRSMGRCSSHRALPCTVLAT